MDASCTPRINGKLLAKFVGRTVLLMVECVGTNSDATVLVRTSGTDIRAVLPPGENFEQKYAQLTCKIMQRGTQFELEVHKLMSAGDNFDMDNYDQLVALANDKYQHLFM